LGAVLETLRRGRRWGTAALVVGVGGVFVAYLGLGGPMQCTRTAAVVQVGDRYYYAGDFNRVLEQQDRYLQERLGDGYDRRQAEEWLKQATQSTLIRQAILAEEARRLGLGASREEERAAVRAIPGLADAQGRVDRETYERFYLYEYGSEDAFRRALRDDLLVAKMQRLLLASAYVSEAEARDAALYAGEEIRLAYVAFAENPDEAAATITDEDVTAFLAGSAERVKALYEERRDQFVQDEAVQARHILIQVAPDADEGEVAEAETRAATARARIEGGEDFAAVAEEISDDPGSRPRGGDLGFFGRGQMTPPFEEAAFAALPGDLVGPVRSDFGFHVILVESRREAGEQTLEQVQADLARELVAQDRAGASLRVQAEALRDALGESGSLEQAARDAGLTLERTGWIGRRPDGFVAGIGASLALQDTAFALTPEAPSPPRIFEVQAKLVLVQLLERRGPEEEAMQLAIANEQERLLDARRNEILEQWIESRRRELSAEGRLYVNLAALDQPSGR
jgi:peptidyl-prolyl cis-trans isomerase D